MPLDTLSVFAADNQPHTALHAPVEYLGT